MTRVGSQHHSKKKCILRVLIGLEWKFIIRNFFIMCKLLSCLERGHWEPIMRTYDSSFRNCIMRVKEQRYILHEIRKRKANWIGHILRRNCILQRVIEGKIQGGDRSDKEEDVGSYWMTLRK